MAGEALGSLETVHRLMSAVAAGEPLFPATEIFNEGWMLRLLMASHHAGTGGLPIPLVEGSRWFSEAEMVSAFRHRTRSDELAETATKADGLVGTFELRRGTSAGPELRPGATQAVVIEAKMGSGLSPGTKRVAWFDQAARNFSVLAHLIESTPTALATLTSVGLVVIAPEERLRKDPRFQQFTDRQGVLDRVARRIDLYVDDSGHHDKLTAWMVQTVRPLWEQATIGCWSWEGLISSTDDVVRTDLAEFYLRCCELNRVLPPPADFALEWQPVPPPIVFDLSGQRPSPY